MELAYRLHRFAVRVGIVGALGWGITVGDLLQGLWAAAVVVGFMCGGIGALLHEYDKSRPGRLDPVHPAGRPMTISGYGYLAVIVVAGFVPTGVAIAMLVGVIADFWMGHHVVMSQRRAPAYVPV